MNKEQSWSSIGLGLILLAILGWVVIYVIDELRQAPWQLLTIIIGLIGAVIKVAADLNIQIRNEQIEKKVPIYEELIEFLFEIIFSAKLGHQQKTEQEIIDFMINITPKMILWASDEVLKDFRQFRQTGLNNNGTQESGRQLISIFEKMILNIRKDLGHNNNKFSENFILGIFVHDVEDK